MHVSTHRLEATQSFRHTTGPKTARAPETIFKNGVLAIFELEI
jgi:hypothetical protein